MKVAMRYDVNFATSPTNLRRVFHVLDEFKPNLVHQHGQFFDLTWMTAIWARRRKVPAVLTVHTPLIHTSAPHAFMLWVADMMLARPFLAVGRPIVVVVDRFMEAYARRRYSLPDSRLRTLPIGVNVDRFRRANCTEAKRQLGLSDRMVILSLGHVIPLRDRLALVEALPYVVTCHPDVAVVVAGAVHDDRFLRRAEDLGVRDHIVLTGPVRRDDVPLYISAADVETHDLQGYGLGTASLEVMAAGVPVVSVVRQDNFPGLELRNWENIVMVPPDDAVALAHALTRLLSDRELAQRVGEGQCCFIRNHFDMDVVVRQHINLYEELAGSEVVPDLVDATSP
jgi:glycosyltransferase involved in cell wall biosynthesis